VKNIGSPPTSASWRAAFLFPKPVACARGQGSVEFAAGVPGFGAPALLRVVAAEEWGIV